MIVCYSMSRAQVKCVPWLPSVPWAKRSLDLVPVRAAMAAPVVTLREQMRLDDVRQVLRDSRHNGFPVVRDSPAGQVHLLSQDLLVSFLVDCAKSVWRPVPSGEKLTLSSEGCSRAHTRLHKYTAALT